MTPVGIQIVPYDPRWPTNFEVVKQRLLAIFGNLDPEIYIDHIGSTSVPGLAAKDCIDVQVTLPNFKNELIESVNECLKAHSFPEIVACEDHLPPQNKLDASHWKKFFLKGAPFPFRSHIHFRAAGKENQNYPLLFRDYLRSHPLVAEGYARTKVQLSVHCKDLNSYYDIKDPVCDIIFEQAKLWAEIHKVS